MKLSRIRGVAIVACAAAVRCAACPALAADQAEALSLDDALARVAQCHPDVRAASATVAGVDADALTAAQRPNPQLTLGAGSINPSGYGSGALWNKTFDHQLRIDQPIERGGKPALRLAAASALRQAARADLADALRQARLATARAFADLAAAQARRQQVADSVELNAQSMRALQQRVRAGDAAPLDATRFALDDLRVQADLAQGEADLRAAQWQLGQFIGALALAPRLHVQSVEVVPPQPLDAQAVERRPDVVAANARLEAARSNAELAHALRTRDVSVGLQLDRYPASIANPSGTGNTVSISVSVPLFVRHAYEGENARALADRSAAEEALRRVRAAAAADLARAQSLWNAADQRWRLASEQLEPAAQKVADGAELSYRRGASGVLEVLDARRNLRAARIERITAEADRAKAAAEVQAACQTLSPAPSP